MGEGVAQDFGKAVDLLTQAAEKGNEFAMIGLASMYRQGQGVPQNFPKAIELYNRAIEQGNDVALVGMAVMYEKGMHKIFSPGFFFVLADVWVCKGWE